MRKVFALAISCCALAIASDRAFAWHDEGHKVIALIADHFLQPATRNTIRAMLAVDKDDLTRHDIASEATWADKFAFTPAGRERTSQWHFMDIEIDRPSLDKACFAHPALRPGTLAANGPAKACLVDKINQFARELGDQAIAPAERLIALKFLLHLIGDLHHPLHVADHHDLGGHRVQVFAASFGAGSLHNFWGADFVNALGDDSAAIAMDLISRISSQDADNWASGSPESWAEESFALARDHAYGLLPAPESDGSYHLTDAYIKDARNVVAGQLRRAGIRLAMVLNAALGGHVSIARPPQEAHNGAARNE